MKYGTKLSPKVKSGIDYRDGVLVTNVSSTKELKKSTKGNGFNLTHSATFPLGVPAICGLLSTKKGDTVLDCFTGTSTTGKFALEHKRKFIGFEVNPQFVMASQVNLIEIQFYSRDLDAEQRLLKDNNYNLGSDYFDSTLLLNKNQTDYNSMQKVSPELSNSFKTLTMAFNDCFQVIQRMR